MHKILILMGAMMLFSSCSSDHPSNYKDKTPKFDIRHYFDGKVEAWGLLQDRQGKVTRRFKVKMIGNWEKDKGTLTEYFDFDDGEKQERIWEVTMKDDHSFTAKATDSVGEAQGTQYGNVMQMKYVLRVPYKGSTIDITLDDWMHLIDDTHLINISTMKKWGFNVGKITIGFEKK